MPSRQVYVLTDILDVYFCPWCALLENQFLKSLVFFFFLNQSLIVQLDTSLIVKLSIGYWSEPFVLRLILDDIFSSFLLYSRSCYLHSKCILLCDAILSQALRRLSNAPVFLIHDCHAILSEVATIKSTILFHVWNYLSALLTLSLHFLDKICCINVLNPYTIPRSHSFRSYRCASVKSVSLYEVSSQKNSFFYY